MEIRNKMKNNKIKIIKIKKSRLLTNHNNSRKRMKDKQLKIKGKIRMKKGNKNNNNNSKKRWKKNLKFMCPLQRETLKLEFQQRIMRIISKWKILFYHCKKKI